MYIFNVLMRSGNKATVTKDSIFTLCHYCIVLIGSHWDVSTLPPKPSRSHPSYIFAPSLSATLCLSRHLARLPNKFAFSSTPSVLPETTKSSIPSLSTQPRCGRMRSAFSQLRLKSARTKTQNQDVSDHHSNDKVSASALT